MAKISIKALIVSNLADILITFVPYFLIGLYIILSPLKPDMSESQVAHIAMSRFLSMICNCMAFNSIYALGMVSTVIAGYIAARIAKRSLLLNALLSCTSCLVSSIQHDKIVIMIVLTPLLAMLGGYLYMMQIRRKIININPTPLDQGHIG